MSMAIALLVFSAVLLAIATNGVVSTVVRRRSGLPVGALAVVTSAATLGCLALLLLAATHA